MSIEKPRQSFGKRLAKLFLPVLIGVNVPFLCIQIDSLLNPIDIDKAGNFAMEGSQAFDYIVVPVVFLILLLVQGLIILPRWNRMCLKYRRVLLSSLGMGIIFSVILGALLGYLVWANQPGLNNKQIDMDSLTNSGLLMSGFVVVYSILNIITLYLLDRSYIKHLKPQKLKSN
jgi:hypothetical protein